MEYKLLPNDELTHWGIKGMRWGVRRYQNKDGSLTPRGQKRYNEELKKVREEEKILKTRQATKAKLDKLEARRKAVSDKNKELDDEEAAKNPRKKLFNRDKSERKVGKKAGKKALKDMTDEELAAAINRARLEDTYRQLRPEHPAKQQTVLSKFMKDAVQPAALNAGKSFIEKGLGKLAEKVLEDKIDPNSLAGLKKTYDKLKVKSDIDQLMNPDKYKSAKDKAVEQKLRFDAEDRDAQSRGYGSVLEEAQAKRNAAQGRP